MKKVPAILLAAVAVGFATYRLLDGPGPPAPALRDPPRLPRPTERERVEHFYALFTSGEQTEVGGRRVPTWEVIGERALFDRGVPAWDYVLSPDRYAEYHRSPNIVANLLRVLPRHRIAGAHRNLYPFLLHFLDPANYPPAPQGADWAKGFRKPIFAIFTHYPDDRASAACVDELDRRFPGEDLRNEAVMVLLRVGRTAPLLDRFGTMPPALRLFLLARLYEFADAPGTHVATARSFADRLEATLDSDVPFERVYAAATLLRIGTVDGMDERLFDEHRAATLAGDHDAAWTAIRALLASGKGDTERAFRLCLETAREGEVPLARDVANTLLRRHFLDRPEVLALVKEQLRAAPADRPLDLRLLLALLRADRADAGAVVKDMLAGDDPVRRADALRFVRTKRAMPEAGPWVLELARKTPDRDLKLNCYQVLTVLETRPALPLMRAELESPDPALRVAAAQAVLAMEDGQGLRRVGELVRGGDQALLGSLAQRAERGGAIGIPSQIVHDLARAVAGLPGEEGRLRALFILRCRGVFEDVREPLSEAYRAEPSRRVASQIETTLRELAFR